VGAAPRYRQAGGASKTVPAEGLEPSRCVNTNGFECVSYGRKSGRYGANSRLSGALNGKNWDTSDQVGREHPAGNTAISCVVPPHSQSRSDSSRFGATGAEALLRAGPRRPPAPAVRDRSKAIPCLSHPQPSSHVRFVARDEGRPDADRQRGPGAQRERHGDLQPPCPRSGDGKSVWLVTARESLLSAPTAAGGPLEFRSSGRSRH